MLVHCTGRFREPARGYKAVEPFICLVSKFTATPRLRLFKCHVRVYESLFSAIAVVSNYVFVGG